MQPEQIAAVIARDLMNHGEQEMATSVQFHNKHGVFLSLLSLDELTEFIAKHLRGEIEHSLQPVDLDGERLVKNDPEAYLLTNGWSHLVTEEDGCDTWTFPWDRRNEWPQWVKDKHGTQHFWDMDEAIELQRKIAGSITPQPVDWPDKPGWWWMEDSGESFAVLFNGMTVLCDGMKLDATSLIGSRFLPAHIPTFPERTN